jgi:hypothetical protein
VQVKFIYFLADIIIALINAPRKEKRRDAKAQGRRGFYKDKDGVIKLILRDLLKTEDWVCNFASYNDGHWITVEEVKQNLGLKDWIELYKRNLRADYSNN